MSQAGPLIYQITDKGRSCIADLDSGALDLTNQASVNSRVGPEGGNEFWILSSKY